MEFNYCPSCGSKCKKESIKMYVCSKCKKEWYDEPHVAVGTIVQSNIKKDKYLFIVRNVNPYKGSVALVGGYLDNGETLEEAAAREALEEAGVKITNIKYFSSYHKKIMTGRVLSNILTVIFTGSTKDEARIVDRKETKDVFWLSKDEIEIEKIKLPDVKEAVVNYFNINK